MASLLTGLLLGAPSYGLFLVPRVCPCGLPLQEAVELLTRQLAAKKAEAEAHLGQGQAQRHIHQVLLVRA